VDDAKPPGQAKPPGDNQPGHDPQIEPDGEHEAPPPPEKPATPPGIAGFFYDNLPYVFLWLFLFAYFLAPLFMEGESEERKASREKERARMAEVTRELGEQSLEKQKAFADRLAEGKASREDYVTATIAGVVFLAFFGVTVAFVLLALLGRLPPSAGPLRPPPWGGLSLILKIFPLWLFVSVAAGELCGAVLALSPSLAGLRIIMIFSGISNVAAVAALAVVLRFEYGAGRDDFGFPREQIIPAAVLGAFLILALQLPVLFLKLGWMQVLDYLEVAQDINAVFVYMHESPSPYNAFLLFPVIAVIVPIGEEFIFRGLLYGGLRRVMGAGAAIIISAILFASVHDAWSDRVPLFVLGAVFAWLYERTRSLVAPIVAHAVNNAIALGQYYLLN